MSLQNKERVLITGASSGIGFSLAKIFAKNGYNLILAARNKERLLEIQKISHEHKHEHKIEADIFQCDLKKVDDLEKLANFAIEKKVTTLINNAALPCPGKSLDQISITELNDLISTNFYAPILLTKLLYSHFLSIKNANIVNINSMVGLEVKKMRSVYSATKWGLRGFSNSLREEAKENSIHVMSVYPTNVKTRSYHENAMDVEMVTAKIYEAFLEKKAELIIDGRIKN